MKLFRDWKIKSFPTLFYENSLVSWLWSIVLPYAVLSVLQKVWFGLAYVAGFGLVGARFGLVETRFGLAVNAIL